MQQIAEIHDLEAARAVLNETRVELLEHLREPKTCAELAAALGHSPQRIHNHLKELLRVGLIRVVRRRRVKNLLEATYAAVAKVYWLSPRLVRANDRRVREEISLHALLEAAESIHEDVAKLLARPEDEEVPSLSFTVDLQLASAEHRSAFARDVLTALRPILERYQGPPTSEHAYRFRLICHPNPSPPEPRANA